MQSVYNILPKILKEKEYNSLKNRILKINEIEEIQPVVFWSNSKAPAFEVLANIVQIEELFSLRGFLKEFWFKYTKLMLIEIFSRYTLLWPDDLKARFIRCVNYINSLEDMALSKNKNPWKNYINADDLEEKTGIKNIIECDELKQPICMSKTKYPYFILN